MYGSAPTGRHANGKIHASGAGKHNLSRTFAGVENGALIDGDDVVPFVVREVLSQLHVLNS
jgi:hypothetical protein